MIMELFPDPRRLTDQEIEEWFLRILVAGVGMPNVEQAAASVGIFLEQQRRAAMTSHERIALARSLAEERAQ